MEKFKTRKKSMFYRSRSPQKVPDEKTLNEIKDLSKNKAAFSEHHRQKSIVLYDEDDGSHFGGLRNGGLDNPADGTSPGKDPADGHVVKTMKRNR